MGWEENQGEVLYSLVSRGDLKKVKEHVTRVRSEAMAKVGEQAYKIEAAMRKIMDYSGGLLGYTSAHTAIEDGNTEILKYLLESGANELAVDNVGTSLLHVAASESRLDCIDTLIRARVNIDEKDSNGDTAMHWACSRGNLTVVQMLKVKGGSFNIKNNTGNPPIFNAIACGHQDVIEYMISGGAKFSDANNKGDTTLHVAASCNQLAVVALLLDHGCRKDIRNKDGKLPGDMTKKVGMEVFFPTAEPNPASPQGSVPPSPSVEAKKLQMTFPVAKLDKKGVDDLYDNLKDFEAEQSTTAHEALFFFLQGFMDKLSWYRILETYKPEEPTSVITGPDLGFLAAYIRFSGDHGRDVRPLNLDVRVEGDALRLLIPLRCSLLQVESTSSIMFVEDRERAHACVDNGSEFATIGTEVGKFISATVIPTGSEITRAFALESLGRHSEIDEPTALSAFVIDLSQGAMTPEDGIFVSLLSKRRNAEGAWEAVGEHPVPGFSSDGYPSIMCKSFVVEAIDAGDLLEKGVQLIDI